MPMLDVYISEGALETEAEAELLNRITEILIRYEGFDPADPRTRAISWVLLHRPAAVYVGGAPADAPRYRVVASVPEGQLDAEAREAVVVEVTEAVLDAERGAWPRDPRRVWVFPAEIPEGHWGAAGHIVPLAGILALTGIDAEQARDLAARRITASRTGHTRMS
jgi:phenylpyruvate tautomerase PptA (4-oxalocrotonate tautomerase family)